MTAPQPRPTPPRGTTRVPAGTRPANQHECPGCGEMTERQRIACAPCWRTVPGLLKAKFGESEPGSTARKRVIAQMREHLRGGPDIGGSAS